MKNDFLTAGGDLLKTLPKTQKDKSKRQLVQTFDEEIDRLLVGGFKPGEVILVSYYHGESGLVLDLLEQIVTSNSETTGVLVTEPFTTQRFLPTSDESLLNVNVLTTLTLLELTKSMQSLELDLSHRLTVYHEKLSVIFITGLDILLLPCKISRNQVYCHRLLLLLKKISTLHNVAIVLNVMKEKLSNQIYKILIGKCHTEIQVEPKFNPYNALMKGRSDDLTLTLKLRDPDDRHI